jgi:vacuolar-type H+-ATPase subunit F/Vma7
MEYRLLFETRGPCMFAVLIIDLASESLKDMIAQFIDTFVQTYEDELTDWDGNMRMFKDVLKMVRSIFGTSKLQAGGEKTTRINLVIPESLKDEWERFASDVVHASMSQMIRDAVREYMKKKKLLELPQASVSEDQGMQVFEKMIERIVSKKLEEMLKK